MSDFALGKFPFAKNIIATFLFLSAHKYDPPASANPNELGLNLLPHGGLVEGMVSQPRARVFLYFVKTNLVVNYPTTFSVNTLEPALVEPLLRITCMKVVISLMFEKSPALPAYPFKTCAYLLKVLPTCGPSRIPPGTN
jgi:hypothetical protein